MIPVYIFYSMFGFQRTGDSIWAFADQLGARLPDRRDGRSHDADRRGAAARRRPLAAARGDQPGRRAYDPAFAYEVAHIIQDGLRRMYGDRRAPARRGRLLLPDRLQRADHPAARARATSTSRACCAGIYRSRARPPTGDGDERPRVQLLASGVGVPWALKAQQLLAEDWSVRRRRLVGDVVERAAPRRGRCDECNLLHPGRGRADAVRDAGARRRRRSGRRGQRLHARRARPDRALGARRLARRSAPTASASPTPAPRCAGSSRSTRPSITVAALDSSPAAARSSRSRSRRPPRATTFSTTPRSTPPAASRRISRPQRADLDRQGRVRPGRPGRTEM